MYAEHQRAVGLGFERKFIGHVVGTQMAAFIIDDTQGLRELRQAHPAIALGIEGERCAIEDQFILAADQIGVDRGNAGGGNPLAHHLDPLMMLFQMAGRGIEDEEQFGAGGGGALGRAGFPDVGADVDAAADAAQGHDAGFAAGVEVAFFVENVVIGQASLAVDRRYPAVFNDRRGIVAPPVMLFRMTDDQGDALDTAGQIVERPLAGAVEIRAQQQILRRVAAQRQFRRQQRLGAALPGLAGALDDALDIARQVTDGGIELGNGDAQHERSVVRLVFRVFEGLDAVLDFFLGFFRTAPADDLDELARFEILVVLEEVGNLVEQQGRHVGMRLHIAVHRRQLVDRHGQQLGILAGFVGHGQHADRAAADNDARGQREGADDQHVNRVAVAGDGVRDVAVVAGIVHGCGHEAIDENRAAVLVHFVLDRLGMRRDFDNDVEIVGEGLAGRNLVK